MRQSLLELNGNGKYKPSMRRVRYMLTVDYIGEGTQLIRRRVLLGRFKVMLLKS